MHDATAAGIAVVVLAWLALSIWLFLLSGRGGFWRVARLQASATPREQRGCEVAVIIPARNEADVISEAIRSLQTQLFNGKLHIIVVDDNSSDDTGLQARDAGVTVIGGLPLAPGWTGKLWALEQGVRAAERLCPDYYLFTDADIQHDRLNVASLVALAQERELDLASHMVMLHCRTAIEKLTIPAFVFFFFKLYPPSWIATKDRKTAGAAGGCVLLRPEALRRMGGLAAIRSEIIDDCSLAKAVKLSGGSVWLGLTSRTRSVRPYAGQHEIFSMISRSAFSQLKHSAIQLAGAIAAMAILYLAPPILGIAGYYAALAAWALMTVCYLPMVRFYRLNPLWALTLPLTACFYLIATVHSAVTYWQGQGGEWKGRTQDQRPG